MTPDQETAIAREHLDEGRSLEEIAQAHGLNSDMVVRFAVAREQGRREAEPLITPDMLSMTAQQRFDTAIRQATRRLEVEFERRLQDELTRGIDERILPHWREQLARADDIIRTRNGLGTVTATEFRNIIACLHPDRVLDPDLKRKYTRAFHVIQRAKLILCGSEQEMPSTRVAGTVPRTRAEWEAARERTRQQRQQRGGVARA
jgi:hypothetical protein